MLIKREVQKEEAVEYSQMMKMALNFLPEEQVKKFYGHDDLIEEELLNEAREPEMSNVLKDLFNALHERNTQKLLKVLAGDEERIFYAFKKQLEAKPKLTKREANVLKVISSKRVSLLTISLM